MKNLILIISILFPVLLSTVRTAAQNPVTYPLEYGESVLPLTLIKVAVTVEKETVVPGPYARYAQKYLGAMAPLSARVTHTVTGASLGITEFSFDQGMDAGYRSLTVNSNVYDPVDFSKFTVDRNSVAEKPAETMAQEAAGMIYTLRKRRFDLISGEAGEHVFGAGMQAAIDELARLEEEYVSLFMGKSSRETYTELFEVVPENGKTNYIVCRFSPDDGLVPETDLGASPIVLTLAPEAGMTPVPRSDKKTGTPVRVARWMDCRVLDGTELLAARRLPVFQFGETVIGR